MATLKELVAKHGEEKVVKMVEAQEKTIEARNQYSKKYREDLKAFRAYQAQKKAEGKK